MQKIMLMIFQNNNYITSQDVSSFRADQIAEIVKVKEEHGLNCRIKRIPNGYNIQAETGINVNDYLKGEV